MTNQPSTEPRKANPLIRIAIIWLSILGVVAVYAFAIRATDVDLSQVNDLPQGVYDPPGRPSPSVVRVDHHVDGPHICSVDFGVKPLVANDLAISL